MQHASIRSSYAKFVVLSVGAALALSSLFIGVRIAHAAIAANVATGLTTTGQTIKASSAPTAVIGFNIVSTDAGNEKFASTSIMVAGAGGFTVATELAALGVATSSGIAIYRDDPATGTNGSFDAADDVVPLSATSTFTGATTTLVFAAPETPPANNTDANAGNDYFLVIQTAAGATNGRSFTVSIYPGETGFLVTARTATPDAVTTNAVTLDTVAPAIETSMTGPANGSTGVPVSTFVHMGFSENLDQTTLTPANITFTRGTTTVGAAIRPFPNGFDVISSSPPTFAASSSFAKASTVSTAFFSISGSNPITPQGTYTTPAVGDIVYAQFDTFPPEVGVITDNTLTSGSFKINNFAIFRPAQVTKFATPTASGQVASGALTGVGDLLVANTSANPTTIRYGWHIVTTAAAINNADLRLDGASGQPTYATTTFARLMPSATTTIDASGRLNATTTFAAGDLVFAKLGSGGDNLGSYAWHVVTAAETVNGLLGSGASPGTTTALRLDGAAAAPFFSYSSVVAKIASAAQGSVDGLVAQDATAFSFGDLVFAKTTANASNLNAYNFHFVSNGATGATSTALRFDNASANLETASAYTVTATTGVKDLAGNPLAANATLSFTTGATGSTNTTPPAVVSSQPQGGSQTFPLNSPIKLVFSVAMKSDGGANAVTNTAVVKLSTAVNGNAGTQVSATNTYDSTTNTLTITPAVNLATSTDYVAQILPAAQSTTNTSFPGEYRLYFRTGSGADQSAPTVLGVNPADGSTSISRSQVFTVGFSEDMNPATITSSTITLATQIGATAVSGNVSYNQQNRSASFAPATQLSASTGYTLTIVSGGSGVKDLSNNVLAANYLVRATTTSATDLTQPAVSFANADNFGIAITYTKTMVSGGGPAAVDNVANYTLENPEGTSISLGGKSVVYDAGTKTARITGLSLQNGTPFKVTIATVVQDIAGNSISTSGTPAGNLAYGTVQNSSATGGQLGPGSGTIDQSVQGMTPTRVTPMNRATGAVSNYKVEFLVATSVPALGQIVLTFPNGFDVTNAAKVATSSSFCNADINGPGTGTPIIASVASDNNAGTVTVNLGGNAGTGANNFLCFDLQEIVNSTVPSASGYAVDIKTRDTAAINRMLLENKTAAPFFLGQAGSRTLTVNVFNDYNGNGTIGGTEGIPSVRVFLFSPAIGGNSTTTNASGVATFTQLADGDYMIGLDPGTLTAASSTVSINPIPQPFTVSATNLTKNFIASGMGSTVTISGNVTGPNGTSVDVFAGSSKGFARTTIALTGSAVAYALRVSPNDNYNVGVGPAMPEAFFTPGAPPPPPPTFTFMPPPPRQVPVAAASVSGVNFTLSAASQTITGSVVDANGNAVSNAGVFARPVESSTLGGTEVGFGTGGMTGTSGTFSLNVVPGSYLVGVAKPGMPSVPDQQITVTADGNTPSSLTFKLGKGTSLTISGTVKDDSGNAVPYAGVGGRKITSTTNTTPIGGGQGNFVGGPTDANGAYTLYVDAGTWQIEAFAPGFGRLGSKTVTITTSSMSGQDFSAQTMSMGTITGSTTRESVARQGIIVRAEGSAGANMAVSDTDGSYALKVPAGSYTVSCMFPGIGDVQIADAVVVTANNTTTGANCAMAAPITITVQLTDGANPITNAFVDVQSSTGRGNGTGISSTSGIYGVYTISVPPGTYTVRAGHPAYGMIGSTASVSTTQTISYATAGGQLRGVSGQVTAGGSGVNGAWVSLTGTPSAQTNTINLGAQADSNGVFSVSVPSGTYQLRANKPGYISSGATSVQVATAVVDVGAITLTQAARTITGTVRLSGSGVSGAFVDASNGTGGFTVAQTDSAGAYSLAVSNGTWSVRAHSIGYEGGPLSVTVSDNSPANQDITLSAISGFTMRPEKQETVTPTSGGLLTNSDIGSAFKLNIPANALGTGSNAGTVKTQNNTAVPNTTTGTVLSKSAVTISAVDSSGQPIKNLNDKVTVVIPYSDGDIPSGSTESDLQLGVWNDATQSYDILSTTVDTANNTLTATVDHFSDFAPIVSGTSGSSGSSPAPASTAASSGGGGGGGGGSALTAPRAQIVYPDGKVVYVDQQKGASPRAGEKPKAGTVSNAPSSLLSNIAVGTTVSGKFVASLKQGSKGADVTRLQKLLGVDQTGYFGALTRKAVEDFQIKYGLAKKGDTGFGQFGPKTRAKMSEVFGTGAASPSASPQGQAQSGNASVNAAVSFTRALAVGTKGDDVKLLQVMLNGDKDTQVSAEGAGSPGQETTTMGRFTVLALQKFQVKYGIAKRGDVGFGNLGPKTRAKMNELLQAKSGADQSSAAPAANTGASSLLSPAATAPSATAPAAPAAAPAATSTSASAAAATSTSTPAATATAATSTAATAATSTVSIANAATTTSATTTSSQ